MTLAETTALEELVEDQDAESQKLGLLELGGVLHQVGLDLLVPS